MGRHETFDTALPLSAKIHADIGKSFGTAESADENVSATAGKNSFSMAFERLKDINKLLHSSPNRGAAFGSSANSAYETEVEAAAHCQELIWREMLK